MKKIVCIFVLLLATGCTVKSNVNIDYKEKVHEEVIVLEDNSIFSSPTLSKKTVIEKSIKNYSKVLEFRRYDYEVKEGSKQSGVKVYKDYDSICSYFQDTVFNQYVYKHIKCISTDDYYIIENDTEYIPYCEGCSDWPELNNIELNITLPIEATESSADKVNKKTYTWVFNENTHVDKEFYLKIDKNELEKNRIAMENKNKVLDVAMIIIKVLIALAVLFVGVLFAKKLYKKYKDNKIDY